MGVSAAGPFTAHLLGNRLGRQSAEGRILQAEGVAVRHFTDADALMTAAAAEAGAVCALVDLTDRQADGLRLLRRPEEGRQPLPVILIDDAAPVDRVVARLKAGAIDYLVRPVAPQALIGSVRAALALTGTWRRIAVPATAAPGRLALLTAKEREVLDLLARGLSSKEIGRALGISPRTAEVHRARVIAKMGVRNGVDLVRLVVGAAAPAPQPQPEACPPELRRQPQPEA